MLEPVFTQEPPFRHGQTPRTAVLFCNLGTPDAPTASALRRYLAEFLGDHRVVEIPRLVWMLILHGIILRIRPAKSALKYASIWTEEGSPLKVWTERQAKALENAFAQHHQHVSVRYAMRYGNPSMASQLDALKAEGVSLTFLAFIAAATARALRENPVLNARVLDDAFVKIRSINLGVAVETPNGLIVPVVRNADELTVKGLARGIEDMALKARDGRVEANDLAGATFTISNPGLKGNFVGAAVISQPNVGILRTGEIVKRPVVVEVDGVDTIAIHPVMFVALSYDHRLLDGREAVMTLVRIKECIEAPERMLLEV